MRSILYPIIQFHLGTFSYYLLGDLLNTYLIEIFNLLKERIELIPVVCLPVEEVCLFQYQIRLSQ